MSLRLVLAMAVVLTTALTAFGCGGSDSDSSANEQSDTASSTAEPSGPSVKTSSLSKPAFIKQANAACTKEREKSIKAVGVYLEKHDERGWPEAVLIAKAFKTAVLPVVEKEIAIIRDLGAPAGDEEEIEVMLAAQQAAVDEVEAQKKLKSTEAFEDFFSDASELYGKYGFESCSLG